MKKPTNCFTISIIVMFILFGAGSAPARDAFDSSAGAGNWKVERERSEQSGISGPGQNRWHDAWDAGNGKPEPAVKPRPKPEPRPQPKPKPEPEPQPKPEPRQETHIQSPPSPPTPPAQNDNARPASAEELIKLVIKSLQQGNRSLFLSLLGDGSRQSLATVGNDFKMKAEDGEETPAAKLAAALQRAKPVKKEKMVVYYKTSFEKKSFFFHADYNNSTKAWVLEGL